MAPRESLASSPDRIVAGRAADGDVHAFEVLVARHGPLLRAYARRILGSSADVDDVVQETFITAWGELPGLENPAAVKSWLIRIVSRRSIDVVRARREHNNIDDHDVVDGSAKSPEYLAEAGSRGSALSKALSGLPEDQRRCWVLREVSEYSYDDIAEQLGLPVSTVRGLLARARKNLVREMEAWR